MTGFFQSDGKKEPANHHVQSQLDQQLFASIQEGFLRSDIAKKNPYSARYGLPFVACTFVVCLVISLYHTAVASAQM